MRVTHPDSTDYTFPSVRTDSSEFTEQTFQCKVGGNYKNIKEFGKIRSNFAALQTKY